MKKLLTIFIIILSVASAVLPISCSQQAKTEEHDNHEALDHTCPMHPEVRGKMGETCPHCGMALEKISHDDGDHATHNK